MKDYRQRAERVLARRDQLIGKKRIRKKLLVKYAAVASVVCAAMTVCFGAAALWNYITDEKSNDNDSPHSSYTEVYTATAPPTEEYSGGEQDYDRAGEPAVTTVTTVTKEKSTTTTTSRSASETAAAVVYYGDEEQTVTEENKTTTVSVTVSTTTSETKTTSATTVTTTVTTTAVTTTTVTTETTPFVYDPVTVFPTVNSGGVNYCSADIYMDSEEANSYYVLWQQNEELYYSDPETGVEVTDRVTIYGLSNYDEKQEYVIIYFQSVDVYALYRTE